MDWSNVIKLAHVVLGFTLVAGLIGRWGLERRAAAAEDPDTAFALTQAGSLFERLVLLSGPGIILAGLATALVKGYPYLGLTTGWMLLSLVLVLVFPFVLAPLVYIPRTRDIASAMADARAKASSRRSCGPHSQVGPCDWRAGTRLLPRPSSSRSWCCGPSELGRAAKAWMTIGASV